MATYTVSTNNEIYTITNTGNSSFTLLVSKKGCGSNEWENLHTVVLEVAESYEFSAFQGFFKIEIKEGVLITETFYLKNYLDTLENLADILKKVFCGIDACNNCENNYTEEELTLIAYSKMEMLKRLLYPTLTPFLTEAYSHYNCYDEDLLECNTNSEIVQGIYNSPLKLLVRMLAIDFYVLYSYYKAFEGNDLIPEFTYIDSLLNSEELICCIEKNVGISFKDFEVNLATFIINVETGPAGNLPPSSVGDNIATVFSVEGVTVNTEFDPPLVFTREMFTTETTPPYSDPEGDSAYKLRINTLPLYGTIKLGNVSVVPGQKILFTEIDAGNLEYYPDDTLEQDHSINFTFSVSDEGSQQYTS